MSSPITPQERKALVDSYAVAHSQLMDALTNLPKEMWKYKPSPRRWSIHEIIVHLADAEMSSAIRLRTFLAMPGATVFAYDQDLFAEKLRYHDHSVVTALDLFRVVRQSNVSILRATEDAAFANTVMHPERGSITLDDWLHIYESHTPKHIEQMRTNYDQWKVAQGK